MENVNGTNGTSVHSNGKVSDEWQDEIDKIERGESAWQKAERIRLEEKKVLSHPPQKKNETAKNGNAGQDAMIDAQPQPQPLLIEFWQKESEIQPRDWFDTELATGKRNHNLCRAWWCQWRKAYWRNDVTNCSKEKSLQDGRATSGIDPLCGTHIANIETRGLFTARAESGYRFIGGR